MNRIVRGLLTSFALAALFLATAGRCTAQVVVLPPRVIEALPSAAYYPPATAYYYAPPAVSYYRPAPSYYAPPAAPAYVEQASYYEAPVTAYAAPAVSYYAAPTVSYYAPATYPAQTVTTRYGVLGRPRVSVSRYYAP